MGASLLLNFPEQPGPWKSAEVGFVPTASQALPAIQESPMPQRQKTVVQDHGPLLAGLPVWVDEVSSFLFGLSEVLKTARRIRTLGEHGDHIELSAAEAERISRDLDDLMVTGTDLRKHLGKAA